MNLFGRMPAHRARTAEIDPQQSENFGLPPEIQRLACPGNETACSASRVHVSWPARVKNPARPPTRLGKPTDCRGHGL